MRAGDSGRYSLGYHRVSTTHGEAGIISCDWPVWLTRAAYYKIVAADSWFYLALVRRSW